MATSGVLVHSFTLEKYLKISPSDDMAYNILGSGNMVPIRLVKRAKMAPTVTIHLISFHPKLSKMNGKGASESCHRKKRYNKNNNNNNIQK